ncbi:MAG TPA: response regulator [Thermoanaerobaculia bacterium]|nr:response regulator [Thermoanaerobaculia bacterium]
MNLHALVIENDAGTRTLLDVLLSRIGYEVDLVADGADAVTLLELVDYDFIVLDLMLGGMSGGDIIGWMAAHRPEAVGRTLMLSAAAGVHIERVQRQWPDVRVMRKPFDIGAVHEVGRRLAEGRVPRRLTAAEEFYRRSIAAGAKAGLIVRRSGDALLHVDHFGYASGDVEGWFPLALDAPLPICSAVRLARPVWLASVTLASAEYPLLVPVWKANQSRALAAVPVARGGRIVGAAGWSFRDPRRFHEAEQRLFAAVAELTAELIEPSRQSTALAGA